MKLSGLGRTSLLQLPEACSHTRWEEAASRREKLPYGKNGVAAALMGKAGDTVSPGTSQSEGSEFRLERPPGAQRFRLFTLQMRKPRTAPTVSRRRQDLGSPPELPGRNSAPTCPTYSKPPSSGLPDSVCSASQGAREGPGLGVKPRTQAPIQQLTYPVTLLQSSSGLFFVFSSSGLDFLLCKMGMMISVPFLELNGR